MTTAKEQLTELQDTVNGLVNQVGELQERIGLQDTRLRSMEVAAPAALRTLSADTVGEAIAQDPYVRFEVLEDWNRSATAQFVKGAIIRADHAPHLRDYVKAGLKIGEPQDQGAVIARLRKEKQARIAAAEAEGHAASAAANRAEADLRAARTQAELAGGDIAALG